MILSNSTNLNLDEDAIAEKLAEGLAEEYPDLEFQVTVTRGTGTTRDMDIQTSFDYTIYIVVASAAMSSCIVLYIACYYRKKQRNSDKHNAVEIEMEREEPLKSATDVRR